MKKKLLVFVLCLIFLGSFMGLMSACTEVGEIPVQAVAVENTEIFLSTSEMSNTFQIKPTIYPSNATNQKVVFSVEIQNYITVTSTGEIKALKETEKDKPVKVFVTSAENDKISATIYVTVENVQAVEVYFDPAEVEVYKGSEPFKVNPQFIPSHASVGTEITYASTNEDVIHVDVDGTVTIVGVGTASVQATTAFGGALGFMRVIVKYTPPMYELWYSDVHAENFNQEPGVPRPITFSLIRKGPNSDPEPRITWSDGRREIDTAKDNDLICTYLPDEDITPGIYTITVTIKDRDDQVVVLTSKPISIYSSLLVEGMNFVNNGSYEIGYGDRISRTIRISEGQRPPEGYTWYYYEWDSAREGFNGSDKSIYDFIIKNKSKPSRSSDGDFVQFATSTANGDVQNFEGSLEAEGKVFIFVVPIVAGETRYDLFCGDSTPYTVTSSLKTDIDDLRVTFNYSGVTTMPKLVWSTLSSRNEYVVEIIKTNKDGSEVDTQYFYSDRESDSHMFVGSSFVLPDDVYLKSQSFVARVKTIDSGTSWSPSVAYDGTLASLRLEPYFASITTTNISRYMYDMRDLGTLLNYLRVVRPTRSSVGVVYEQSQIAGFSHKYSIDLALAFITDTLDAKQGEGGLYETRRVNYFDGREPDLGHSEVLVKSVETNTPADRMMQTLRVAFAAYCEAGHGQFTVYNAEYVASDGVYYVTFDYYVNADDATITTVTNEQNLKIVPKVFQNESSVTTAKGNGETIEYFKNNDFEVEVTTSDQLYMVAQMGYKPVPKAGSAAAAAYQEVKKVMDSIVSVDMTDRERVIAIYDWLVNNVYYDHNAAMDADIKNNDASFRIEGVFGIGTTGSRRLALCDGYAKAFVLMCWMAEVPSYKVTGYVKTTTAGGAVNSEGHAWNRVFVEGEWSVVDATWGSTQSANIDGKDVEISSHKYLFRTEDFIRSENHYSLGSYPDANTLDYGEYGYYKYVGAYGEATDASDIASYLLDAEKGVLNALVKDGILGVDIAVHESAMSDSSLRISEYLLMLMDLLVDHGYDLTIDHCITLTDIEGYGTDGEAVVILKLYIKKITE